MGHRRLVKRHEEILAAIIHRYVESGAPALPSTFPPVRLAGFIPKVRF